MKPLRMVIGAFSVFIAVLVFSFVISKKGKADNSALTYSGDALITQSIQSMFTANKDVGGTVINVKTSNGSVLLSGFAKNEEEKSAAEGLAHKVRGVKSVKNEVTVRP